jgi:glycosyltransferase involved in cell wall biosynthesis
MERLVSVVIPAHNSIPYIVETLDSVFAQQHRPLEVLVVDDGSTDSTANVIRESYPEVRLIQQQQRGHAAARNAGILAARGAFLSFLDHDDLWSADKLDLQLVCFARDPELDLVFGHMQNFFTPEMPAVERERIAVPLHPIPGQLQGSMLARRKSFDRVGFFDEARGMGDFLDWYGRATLAGLRMLMLEETVVHRRIHANNYQRTHKHERGQILRAVKDLLDRRRAAG